MRQLAVISIILAAGALAACGGTTATPTDDGGTDGPTETGGGPWPPPGTLDIVGIGSGRVDGDPFDDLIVIDGSGGGNVYLLRGAVDVRADRASPALTFTARAPLPGLRGPAAAAVLTDLNDVPRIVVLDNPASGVRLTVFGPDLMQSGQTVPDPGAPAAASTDLVSLHASTFGPNGGAIIGTAPNAVVFLEKSDLADLVPVMRLPGAGGGRTQFTAVRAADGYSSAMQRFVVSQAVSAQRATIDGANWSWTTLRDEGAPPIMTWHAQATSTITADVYPDVVGYDRKDGTSADLCVIDVEAGLKGCQNQPIVGLNPVLAVGNVSALGTHDAVLMAPAGPSVTLVIVPDLQMTGGAVTTAPPTTPRQFSVTRGLMTIAKLDNSGLAKILLVGRDGAILCAKGSGLACP